VWSQQRQLVCLQVSSEHADDAISFVAKDERRRIFVEGHAPDDLPIRSWLGQMAFRVNLKGRQIVALVSLGLTRLSPPMRMIGMSHVTRDTARHALWYPCVPVRWAPECAK